MDDAAVWRRVRNVWLTESGPRVRDLLAELGDALAERFRIYPRHHAALDELAEEQGRIGRREALRRVAVVAAWEASGAPDIDGFYREGLAAMERTLRPLRDHILPLATGGTTSGTGLSEAVARDLEERLLSSPDLTPGERAVVAARIEIGDGVRHDDVAQKTGLTVGSVRHLTSRSRKKLRPLVHTLDDSGA